MAEHKRPRWCSVTQHTVSKIQQIASGPRLMLWPITERGLALLYQLLSANCVARAFWTLSSLYFLCCHLFAMKANAAGFLCKSFQLRGLREMLLRVWILTSEQNNPAFRRGKIFLSANNTSFIKASTNQSGPNDKMYCLQAQHYPSRHWTCFRLWS